MYKLDYSYNDLINYPLYICDEPAYLQLSLSALSFIYNFIYLNSLFLLSNMLIWPRTARLSNVLSRGESHYSPCHIHI